MQKFKVSFFEAILTNFSQQKLPLGTKGLSTILLFHHQISPHISSMAYPFRSLAAVTVCLFHADDRPCAASSPKVAKHQGGGVVQAVAGMTPDRV